MTNRHNLSDKIQLSQCDDVCFQKILGLINAIDAHQLHKYSGLFTMSLTWGA